MTCNGQGPASWEVAWNRYPDLLQLPPYQEHVKPFVEKPEAWFR